MDTKKQRQVAEVIKRNLSMVLQDEGGYIYGVAPLVTVTEVKMTPDFSIAKVYFSVFNIEDKQTPIIAMEANNARLRHALAKRIKSAVIPVSIIFNGDGGVNNIFGNLIVRHVLAIFFSKFGVNDISFSIINSGGLSNRKFVEIVDVGESPANDKNEQRKK